MYDGANKKVTEELVMDGNGHAILVSGRILQYSVACSGNPSLLKLHKEVRPIINNSLTEAQGLYLHVKCV
jgi:hypothetical protein